MGGKCNLTSRLPRTWARCLKALSSPERLLESLYRALVLGQVQKPEYVEIEFESGTPIAVNGEKLSAAKIVEQLNAIGGAHGIGRVDLVEKSNSVGMKSHGVYETPGGTILLFAHRELESLILDRETMHFKEMVAVKYAELAYNGLWFTPLREAFDAFVNTTQGPVTGTVRLKLYKGNIISAGRKSPFSLYREDFATFGEEDVYDQNLCRRLYPALRPQLKKPRAQRLARLRPRHAQAGLFALQERLDDDTVGRTLRSKTRRRGLEFKFLAAGRSTHGDLGCGWKPRLGECFAQS